MTAADELEDFQLSELEKKAQERRERLKNLRANRTLANDVAENGDAEGLLGIVGRRSYQPVNVGTANVNEDVKEVIEGTDESVRQIIDDSKNLALGDNLDVSIIAPRKVDWDLRRGVQDKLDKLSQRTNNAINNIVKQTLYKSQNISPVNE